MRQYTQQNKIDEREIYSMKMGSITSAVSVVEHRKV
jgi:hypothetical protein